MSKMRCELWLLVVGFLIVATGPLRAEEWPQFLGPARNGISAESGLLSEWPAGGIPEVWRVGGGVGMSAVVVADGLAVTMVQRGDGQEVLALDAKNGGSRWATSIAPDYGNPQGDGPRATPVIVGDRIIAFSGQGQLACLAAATGEIVWTQDTLATWRGRVADYGMASSPLVIDDHVIVTIGAPQATVAAFGLADGEPAWTAGTDSAGYSSPAVLTIGDRRQLVVFTGKSALGLAPQDGTLLWRYPFETDFDCNIMTPLAHDGSVFLSAGENHGSALLKISPADNGGFDVQETWTSYGSRSVLRCEWQTPILQGRHLYGFDNVGGAGPISHFTCVDVVTGERQWQEPRFGKGNLIAADGKLFMTTLEGELVIAEIDATSYREIGRMDVLGRTRQAPSLSDGRLYLRDDQHIVCLDVSRP